MALDRLGADIGKRGLSLEQVRLGMEVEINRGTWDHTTDLAADVRAKAAELTLAHLAVMPEYYTYLTGVAVTMTKLQGRYEGLCRHCSG